MTPEAGGHGAGPGPEVDTYVDTYSESDDPETAEEKSDPEAPWERLSWRMLLVDPLGSLTRLAPLFLISL